MARRSVRLVIRCGEDTARNFRVFVAQNGFATQEDALKFLLQQAQVLNLKPDRYV